MPFRNPYSAVEKSIGYRFRRKRLLERALVHRSFRFEKDDVSEDNQRLEFLGDAALGFAAAAHLYERFDDSNEGILTAFRSQVTSGKALASIAAEIDLGEHVRMGRGEERSGGRRRPSNLADCLEAIIGAAYIDGGARAVQKIFRRLFVPLVDSLSGDIWEDNPKGKLQEYSQRTWKAGPRYRVKGTAGPAHATTFEVEVTLRDGSSAVGCGPSKQQAERQAARNALRAVGPPDGQNTGFDKGDSVS